MYQHHLFLLEAILMPLPTNPDYDPALSPTFPISDMHIQLSPILLKSLDNVAIQCSGDQI